MSKSFIAMKEDIDEIKGMIEPISLLNVHTFVLDFVYDPIDIISGGLDIYSRTISN